MKLSIIIVNYNVKYFLEQCLLSIAESNIDIEIETFVVDNNSKDGSVEYLKPKFPNVTFIANSDNPGFSKANNQAIEIANGDYILILNPDTVLGENVLKDVIAFLEQTPEAGAVGVKMIDGSGLFLRESKRSFPSPWVSFCKISGLTKLFPRSSIFGKYHLYYLHEDSPHEVEVLAGAFIMTRKEVLDKVGLLDEDFFMYGEDIDFSYRIVLAGYKNFYLPFPILHYKGESTKQDMHYVKVFYEAMYIFFKKYYPHYGKLYSGFITFGIAIRGFIAATKRLFTYKQQVKTKKLPNYILFNHESMTYEGMIKEMDRNAKKTNQYLIYSPKSNMTVGAQSFFEGKENHASRE